jgi:2-isopropylmalate synthase
MRPQDVGQPSARLVLGRHSGRHAVQQRCESLGLGLTPGELEHVYHAVISLGENRKAVGDGDLRRIVERIRTASTAASGATSNAVVGSISN